LETPPGLASAAFSFLDRRTQQPLRRKMLQLSAKMPAPLPPSRALQSS
jgi:hypothetical protein